MPVTLVIGAQWGDEGKGRIVDYVARDAHLVARFGGGPNAGHTVRVQDKTYKLRMVPSGVVAGVEHCVIGPGTVVSPAQLVAELDMLAFNGIETSRVWLSDLAHLILPYHVELDCAAEQQRGAQALGTTGTGIGPAYADRVARVGLRAGDLRDMRRARRMLYERADALRRLGIQVNLDVLAAELEAHAERLRPHIRDTVTLVHEVLERGKRIVVEGAQGTLLDVGLGTYPYVTSSTTVAGGAGAGLGFGPREVDCVIGVAKAYVTRVGSGPFPTELAGQQADELRTRGAEFGVVTGRPRRCGWLDLVALRYAVRINGITHLALTKLDILDSFYEIPLCTDYAGNESWAWPFRVACGATPVYETHPGWLRPTVSAHAWEDLPFNARQYVAAIEAQAKVPVSYISVGAERSALVVRPGAPLASAATAEP
jgi:adenylosuccinate synthase